MGDAMFLLNEALHLAGDFYMGVAPTAVTRLTELEAKVMELKHRDE